MWTVFFYYLFNVLLDQSSHCSLLVLLMLFWICSASRVPLLLLLKINTSHYFCKLPGTFKMFLVPSGFWMWWTGNVKNSSYWTDHHLCPQLYPASSLFTYPLNPSLTTFAWPRMAASCSSHAHAHFMPVSSHPYSYPCKRSSMQMPWDTQSWCF